MADDAPQTATRKGKGRLRLVLIGVAATALLGGGGAAAGLYFAGGHGHGPADNPDRPRLVEREGAGEAATPWKGPGPDPRRYQASYYTVEQPFTANLRDSDGFVQLGLGIATYYDHRVLDRLKEDEMPIRSAVLLTLGEQDAGAITTAAGKRALQARLKDAINAVLVQREGFGGVDDVFFTSFVIQ